MSRRKMIGGVLAGCLAVGLSFLGHWLMTIMSPERVLNMFAVYAGIMTALYFVPHKD